MQDHDDKAPELTPSQNGHESQTAAAESTAAKPEEQTVESAQVAQTKTESKLGGKIVAESNREGIFDSFKMNEAVFNLDGVKKAAAWYIETSEKIANQALELQEKATGWAKDTPLAPIFEAQASFARKFVERSASAARSLWQIHPIQ